MQRVSRLILGSFATVAIFLALSLILNRSAGYEESIPDGLPVWVDMMEENWVNIEDARQAFDTYWETNAHFRGDHSNRFERWYEIHSRRLDRYGRVIPQARVRDEFTRLRTASMVNQEGKWFNYGPINVGPRKNGDKRDGGRVKHVEFHPEDQETFFVSTFKGGLFKTEDGGKTWISLTDHIPHQVFITRIENADPNTIYIGTDLGVMKSVDGGMTWNETGLTTERTAGLEIHGQDESVIIAGNRNGIYRSEDSGATFTRVVVADKVEEVRTHPGNADIMYASTNGSTSQFFRSADGGVTWEEKTGQFGKGAFMKIAVTPAQPDWVYVINSRDHLDDDSFEGVYKSLDSGESFTKQSGSLPCITGYDTQSGGFSRGQPNYNLFIVADPNEPNKLYAGGVKSWYSVNGGLSWQQFYDGVTDQGFSLHVDQLTWAYSPHTNDLYAVNDGGIYILNDKNEFRSITDGLPIAEVWECTQSQINPSNVAGGTFHCGVKLNRDGSWYSPWGGDEATCLFDYSDDMYVYHFKYEKISRSVDGGFSFQRINSLTADRGYYTGTGVLDKSDVNTLYIGLFEVERTQNARAVDNNDVTWEKISSFGGSRRIEKIEQADADHDVLYVSREGNTFHRTDNLKADAPQFLNLTAKLPFTGRVTDIATSDTDPDQVYILLGSQVFSSGDRGETWQNISAGLPGVALLEMIYDKSSEEGLYVGSDIGIYYKDAAMDQWIDYSNGLPAVRVSGMDIYYGPTREESFITVSTDGRGFWRSDLYGVIKAPPTVDFEADRTEIFTGEQVHYTNLSSDIQVGSIKWSFPGGIPAFSIEDEPSVTYEETGTYAVTLTYETTAGTFVKAEDDYIVVTQVPPPVAGFSSDKRIIAKNNFVQFQDTSLNVPAGWQWTFEGGMPATSTDQNPIVQYPETGLFSVSLEVSNAAGSDLVSVTDYVEVVESVGSGDLKAHFTFDGTLADSSSYRRNLVSTGNFTPVFTEDNNGVPMMAFAAPGQSDQFLFNSYRGIGGNGERTITAWIRTTPAGTRKTVISWGQAQTGNMFNLMVHNGNIRVEGGNCNVQNDDSSVARLDNNEWRHIAVTFNPDDGSNLKDVRLYIDGVYYENQPDSGDSFNSESTAINTDTTLNEVQVGNAAYNAQYYWQGELDDIRVYSKALSQSDIVSVMNNLSVSTKETLPEKKIELYPNPVAGMLTVKTSFSDAMTIRMYSISGELVHVVNAPRGHEQVQVDLHHLLPGAYIIRIESGGEQYTQKVFHK